MKSGGSAIARSLFFDGCLESSEPMQDDIGDDNETGNEAGNGEQTF